MPDLVDDSPKDARASTDVSARPAFDPEADLDGLIGEVRDALSAAEASPRAGERAFAALETRLRALSGAVVGQHAALLAQVRRTSTEHKAVQARAEALAGEIKLVRRLLRERDAQLQALRRSATWTFADLIAGLSDVLRGRRSVQNASLGAARAVYRQLPLSLAVRRRIREEALRSLRLYRSLRSHRQVVSAVPRLSRAPETPTFPLPGCVAALAELVGTQPDALDVAVSVVIPTYNAGPEFYWLLRKLRGQRGLRAVEIVVVDSGSTDGTQSLAQDAGCTIVQIEKSQFSHSFSRNLGAEYATGDLLLFTVQDAYPVGEYWLHALSTVLLKPRTEEERVAAVSSAEFPRANSELLYNAMIDTHYRFLGCHSGDRIGQLTGEDHLSLRMQGQLSDVACLIRKSTFDAYLYHGRYAEDLILGIRLIRDGHRIGMLSSVKVIHSHTRPVSYYIRRIFVDVVFLADVFSDFETPEASSVVGTFAAAEAIHQRLSPFLASPSVSASQALGERVEELRRIKLPRTIPPLSACPDFGFAPLRAWFGQFPDPQRTGEPMSKDDLRESERILSMFVDRLTDLNAYLATISPPLDETFAQQLNAAVEKTLAMSVSAQLAFIYLHAELTPGGMDPRLSELKPMLLAGI